MRRPTVMLATALVILGTTGLSGCTGEEAAAPAAPTTPGTATTTGTPSPATPTAGAPGSGTGPGCPANEDRIPPGSRSVSTGDLDHDGRRDTLFLVDDGENSIGVRTATGLTTSTRFSVAEPSELEPHGFLIADGSSFILLGGSRQAYLFAFVGCRVVVTRNAEGEQYRFDNGFARSGTGVGCLRGSDGLTLVGLRAERTTDGDRYQIRRTVIEPMQLGRSARNGPTSVSETGLTREAAFDKVRTGYPC
ncbi:MULTISPECIES: hypothetical protein [unclassified Micromonospora]|uniref:hypothetical protein n=1 Tax=unclassified Micromonospora TaxID=2617518 RepID=UPI001C24AC26|nr:MULTISPECIES: hypothetical protein [unclassified Micromonospora]MBU8855829.1 hypothetical protein [Micromonospora sp. WMMB482]MBU8861849.1 hypothetical protein [Micromonospora sp. WMMB482]MDM4781429.1 hypothetical protein [Micromonospora sp. b486]